MSMLFPHCKNCDHKAEHSVEGDEHGYSCPNCGVKDSKESVEQANMHILVGGDPDPNAASPFVLKEI